MLGRWLSRYEAQGLTIVGITTDPLDAAKSFRDRHDFRYPVASDPQATTSGAYGVSALPTVFLVDRRGVVREVVVGVDSDRNARIEAFLNMLLAEPAPGP